MKKLFALILTFTLLLCCFTSCVEFVETETETSLKQEDTTTNFSETTTEAPKKETFNPYIFENIYASLSCTGPRWIDNPEFGETGWYIAFNCYNTCNKNLDFFISSPDETIWYVWETVYSATNQTFHVYLGTEKIETLPILYHIYISGSDGSSSYTITKAENYILKP